MRRVVLEVGERRWQTHLDAPTPISIPLNFGGPQPRAFGLDQAAAEPVGFGGELADVELGAGFNCSSLRVIPHGNGTHTESAAHVTEASMRLGDLLDEALLPGMLLTVEPVELGRSSDSYTDTAAPTDLVISRGALAESAGRLELPEPFFRTLVVRTLPNDRSKRHRHYSGTNPPYFTREAIEWLCRRDVEHLIVDLPSVDRERDGGDLLAHRTFWGLEPAQTSMPDSNKRTQATITELVYAPNHLDDGAFFVDLQIPDFGLDAVPSRPLLYEARPAD